MMIMDICTIVKRDVNMASFVSNATAVYICTVATSHTRFSDTDKMANSCVCLCVSESVNSLVHVLRCSVQL